MAELSNPLRDDIDEDVKSLFSRLAYHNMNGVEREVEFIGGEVRVEHGLGFAPDISKLTLRPHLAQADIGTIFITRPPDERYIYVNAPRQGKVRLEISHPPRGNNK